MITRREAARAAAITALSYSRILGANDRVGMGVIGTGSRGTEVTRQFLSNPEVELRALCDVYPTKMQRLAQIATAAKKFGDHRELLALKEVDVVLIASPDHRPTRDGLHDRLIDWMNRTRDPFRGYFWLNRPWRTDAPPPSWRFTAMTRQREEEPRYEPRQLDYETGLEMVTATRRK